jgi:hypothetical protein
MGRVEMLLHEFDFRPHDLESCAGATSNETADRVSDATEPHPISRTSLAGVSFRKPRSSMQLCPPATTRSSAVRGVPTSRSRPYSFSES